MSTPMVFVALPVFNRLEETKKFIGCIREQTYPNIQVVICDDGSTDGTGDYLRRSAPEVIVIDGTGDLWWTGGINRCIEYILSVCAEEDLVITINNDVQLKPDYVTQKVERSESMHGAIIGSVCVYQDEPDRIETSGLMLNRITCTTRPLVPTNGSISAIHIRGCVPATNLPAKGVLVPVEVYRKIGIYDFDNFPHYHADTDFTLRAVEQGIPVVVDFDSVVYSDVNRDNLISGDDITLSNIMKTFDKQSGVNNFLAYRAFARKHFGVRAWQYLLVNYSKIFLGLLRRYLMAKVSAFEIARNER